MALEKALYHVIGNKSFEEVSVDELTNFVNAHPYFSTAQLLLAAKLKNSNSSYSYKNQLNKAKLYTSNPFWLYYQLNDTNIDTFNLQKNGGALNKSEYASAGIASKSITDSANTSPHFTEKPFVHPLFETKSFNQPSQTNAIDKGSIISPIENANYSVVKPDSFILGSESSYQPQITLSKPKPIFEEEDEVPPTTSRYQTPTIEPVPVIEAPKLSAGIQWDSYVDVPGVVSFSTPQEKTVAATPTIAEQQPEPVKMVAPSSIQPFSNFAIPTLEAVKQMLAGNTATDASTTQSTQTVLPSAAISKAPIVSEQSIINSISELVAPNFIPVTDFTPAVNTVTISEEAFGETEADADDTEAIEEPIEETNLPHSSNISSMVGSQLASFKKPVSEEDKLDFEKEPYYTIDYFASQGIKIDLTKQPQDKLTSQLRRFTDWLKQMKKVDANPQDLGTDPELENAIADIAKTSVSAREIVTETMADIFVKQDKVDKAIQLYIKLSFLEPEKSAYFASKIQQLKGI